MTELQKMAIEQTKFWIDLANEMYGLNIPHVPVSFNLRGHTAGKAMCRRGIVRDFEIRYNAVLLEENGENFLNRTVPHEVAHLVVYAQYPSRTKPHGYEWKRVMRDFGITPKRCHSYDTSNATVRRRGRLDREYPYKCGCRTHMLTVIRHRRILKGAGYTCKVCRQKLQAVA